MDLLPIAIGVGSLGGVSALALGTAMALRRVVPTNMVHIVQSRGKTTSYGKGRAEGNVYYQWPAALPVIGVSVIHYPESVFTLSLDKYEAYDAGRVPFIVDVRAFFRIKDSNTAAQRVSSFEDLKSQLRFVLEGSVRKVLAGIPLEEIMHDRSKMASDFTEQVDGQLEEWGVMTVKSIEFMDLRDSQGSTVIHDIMAKEKSRIQMESRIVVAENDREAELKEIDAQRTIDVQRQDALQQVGIRTAEKDRLVGVANEQSRQEVLQANKLTTEREMDVKLVQDTKTAEIEKAVAEVRANQDREVQIVAADAERQRIETIARGQLQAAHNEASGIKAKGEAHAAAEAALLMAPVDAQLKLAQGITDYPDYQGYLVQIEQIKAAQVIGVANADAIKAADIKVIANSGDVHGGVSSLGDLFSPKGGTSVAGMIEAFAQTPLGKQIIESVVAKNTAPSNVVNNVAPGMNNPETGRAPKGMKLRNNDI